MDYPEIDQANGYATNISEETSCESEMEELHKLLLVMPFKKRKMFLEQMIASGKVMLGQPYVSGSATSAIEGDMSPVGDVPVSIEKQLEGVKDPILRAEMRQFTKSLDNEMRLNKMKTQGG
ncbi:hypothetical protein [Enterovibrio nigricans]|uniref:Uncharacterized protein n=1 Tax=Enterovibrio nigricans DSM 22720 TaxID=1121868 RepID=A0A1T4V5W3_9GAMM|nr:hypothetical protein [Enterovibrio nigricans]SKA60339.1 hypothetical protein SAMN02745132_03285 [Enterovibrio nigricans DSM 22720]